MGKTAQKYVAWFKDVDKGDGAIVGGKGANLGEMVRAGFPVPNGFIVTSQAYFYFLKENSLDATIRAQLTSLDHSNMSSVQAASTIVKKEIIKGKIPHDLALIIMESYQKLGVGLRGLFTDQLVAVRSSATAEDLKNASFAGQQETFLNIQGEHNLLEAIKKVWASLFEARAIFYRQTNKVDHFTVGIAVPVQRMIESETSGIMFTVDPVTNDKSKVVIEAIYGLGEYIVQGRVTPDHYEVDKKTLTVLQKDIATQDVLFKKVGSENKEVKVPKSIASIQKLTEGQIKKLTELGKQLEHHYFFPQDVEWAIEGGKVYVVQTRPVTTIKTQRASQKVQSDSNKLSAIGNTPILRGDPASPGIATGQVKVVMTTKELHTVEKGDILVAPHTDPDYVSAMQKAVGIVTERGGRTSHAAIVSRELGIPAIVGVEAACKLLRNGMVVTVNGTTGEVFKGGVQQVEKGALREGELRVESSQETKIRTKTKVYVNLAESERALEVSQMDVDGIGLLRAEFMIASLGMHPKQFIEDKKKSVFVEKLSEKMEIFCKSFEPRPVVYRLSDFKTNEYGHLKGGERFEPKEENPMLGFRGAYRYLHDKDVFDMELAVIKKIRGDGFKNLWIMVPFVRTPTELSSVLRLISASGLKRGPSFKIWQMVETPANVVMLEEFIQMGIDGVSIGTNDLTMLMLGVDRDNEKIASLYDERNEAVLWAIERTITLARKHKITSSICGQLPSVHPEIVADLVRWGITSVSISPDVVGQVRDLIAKAEKGRNS